MKPHFSHSRQARRPPNEYLEHGPCGPRGGTSEVDVVVVGGGVAGLTAAVGLAERGLRAAVIESDTCPGGRARSWVDPTTGDPVDVGPHVFVSHYPNLLRLLEVIGTSDGVLWQPSPFATVVDGSLKMDLRTGRLPPPLNWLPSWRADPTLTGRDRLSNLRAAYMGMRLDKAMLDRLDAETASDVLVDLGVSRRSLERYWRLLCLAILNVPLEEASAAALFRLYSRLIGHRDVHLGFADRGLGDLVAIPACRYLQSRGSEVHVDVDAVGFDQLDGRVTGVRLGDGSVIRARATVAAVPPDALHGLSSATWNTIPFEGLACFDPCPYVSTTLWFDEKITHTRMWVQAAAARGEGLNFDFYDVSNIYAGWADRPSVVTTNCINAGHLEEVTDSEIVAATHAEIARVVPAARGARIRHALVRRIPLAIHRPRPGLERHRPPTRTPLPGLYLAGDWLATGLPASMESAAFAGWTAADTVLADFGRALGNGPRLPLAARHADIEGVARLLRRNRRAHTDDLARRVPVMDPEIGEDGPDADLIGSAAS